MLREPPLVQKFADSPKTDELKWSKSGKSYVVKDYKKESPAVVKSKKTQNKNVPNKSSLPTIWTEPYYCLKCKQFLTNHEMIGHGHMDKVLYKPFLDYMAKPKPDGSLNQNSELDSKVKKRK